MQAGALPASRIHESTGLSLLTATAAATLAGPSAATAVTIAVSATASVTANGKHLCYQPYRY